MIIWKCRKKHTHLHTHTLPSRPELREEKPFGVCGCAAHTIRRFILTRDSISPFFPFSLAIHCVLFTAVCCINNNFGRNSTHTPKKNEYTLTESVVSRAPARIERVKRRKWDEGKMIARTQPSRYMCVEKLVENTMLMAATKTT